MKKLLSSLLAAVMVLSCGFSGVYADDVPSASTPVLSQPLKLTPSTCGNGTHSGHQTRIVHTSHGDYAAYLSDEIYSSSGGNSYFNELSIVKIQNGEQKLLFQDYISYDSSSISIFADANENVYAATLVSNKWGNQYGANLAIWAVDTETDEVNGHIANIPFAKAANGGYGYAQPVINDQTGKIYALFSGGDYPNAGVIAWFTFDMASQQWEPDCHYIDIDARHCYHHAFASGNGICLVTQRDVLATSYGYPEVTRGGGNSWWPADYVWDQEDLYMITDMTSNNIFSNVPVAEADYSKLTKGREFTLEERQSRLYPANKVYDTYLDGTELHVIGDTRWYLGAYDRKNREGHVWHRVFDVSDPANVKLLSDNELSVFEGYETPKEGYFVSNSYSPWMVRGADGTFYIAGIRSDYSLKETGETNSSGYVTEKVENGVIGKLQLIQLDGDAQNGYDYNLVYVSESLGNTDSGFSVASGRSKSVEDGVVPLIYTKDGKKDWYYVTLSLPLTCQLTIRYVDENGESLAGASDINITLPQDASYNYPSPNVKGYQLLNSDQASINGTLIQDTTITVRYTPRSYRLIVQYVDENGKKLADGIDKELLYKTPYSFTAPEIDGYKLLDEDLREVEGIMMKNLEMTVRYVPKESKTYTLTIRCVNEKGEPLKDEKGNPLTDEYGKPIEDIVKYVKAGSSYSFDAPRFDGYELMEEDKAIISGKKMTGNVEETLHYTPVGHYVDIDLKIPETVIQNTHLKDTEFNTVEKIQDALVEELNKPSISGNAEVELNKNAILFDAVLKVKNADNIFVDATEKDFEGRDSIEVTINYSELFDLIAGRDINKLKFTILHMHSMNVNGNTAGTIETIKGIRKMNSCLKFYVSGLSPFAILVEEIPDKPSPTPGISYGSSSDSDRTPTPSYTIKFTKNEGGTISPNRKTLLVLEGKTSQTITIKPNEGYMIVDVLIDGKSKGAISTYTFRNVLDDHTFEVKFAKIPAPVAGALEPETNPNTGAC